MADADFHRSIHPTHSVSAGGKHAAYLTEGHHKAPSIFGADSPWQRVIDCEQAKVLSLGISMRLVTFYHAQEDTMDEALPHLCGKKRPTTCPASATTARCGP